MKELSIEEKAKAYDEAIEIARKIHNEHKAQPFNIMLKIFPELKESEDERIRKEIMDFIDTNTIDSDERRDRWFSYLEKHKPISFTSLEDRKVKMSLMQYISELNQDVVHLHPGIETCNEWIAWLEKQGEQQDVNIQINPSEYINDMGGNGCYLKNTAQVSAWSEEFAKEMFIKALERVEEQNNKGYKLTDCDKNSWWEDFKAYTSCAIEQKSADKVIEEEKPLIPQRQIHLEAESR